ncbi:MAG: ABC-F family ATP-binding cassette domain-containing protein [Eubacterium sp.]|jgi:ATP-binding cassette subfamily F protein 3|nr:ABC-F family ATP-binding cassette domain-containing protein [Eubacterium sp.]
MIVSLEKITKHYNGTLVLNNIELTVENNDRIGLVGINGCGKSTLLRIITGLESPDNLSYPNEPKIYKNKDSQIGFLSQNSGFEKDISVYKEMRSVFKKLDNISERMRQIELRMSEIDDHKNNIYCELSEEYSRLSTYFEINEGYLIDIKIDKILNGMGFPPETHDRIISTLSGGEKTRLALAKILLENPTLLILDEPTNHLDFNAVIWLEDYLKDYKGALLIVSHDRYFLDKLCLSICEIERGRLLRFKGNYSLFLKQKKALAEKRLKEYEAQQQKIAKIEDYIARNITRASTSNMAKSRIKMLESMKIIEKPIIYEKAAKIKFEYSIKPPLDILNVNDIDVTIYAGDKSLTLIRSLSFNVRRGDKIGIVGSNGVGKSTLLKVIQHIFPIHKGTLKWADNVKISYFDQENSRLNMNETVIDALHNKYHSMTDVEIRSMLGRVQLTGENAFKKVGSISGGERAKLCFALMMLEHGNVLILDEPTNHLDISTREVIENALYEFDGTEIFVSHDRYLLNKISTRIIEITENNLNNYMGGFEEYVNIKRAESIIKHKKAESAGIDEKFEKIYRSRDQRSEEAKKRQRKKNLEMEIDRLESEVLKIEAEIADPQIFSDYILAREKCVELEKTREVLNKFIDEWLSDN